MEEEESSPSNATEEGGWEDITEVSAARGLLGRLGV